MKRLLLIGCFTLFTLAAFSQAPPQAICYQAVAADDQGNELQEVEISIRVTIIKGNPNTGEEVWVESHTNEKTDEFGLFDINVGEGIKESGTANSFGDIPWGIDAFYLKIEMDPTNGTNYVDMGTNQILSVPYSLFAGGANRALSADVASTANYADNAGMAIHADSANYAVNAGTSIYADTTTYADNAGVANMALEASTALDDFDKDFTNELQNLSFDTLTGTLSIDNGNAVVISTMDDDSDPSNELQDLVFDGQTLSLNLPNGTTTSSVDLNNYTFARPGASFDFPQGILGDHKILKSGLYTVPPGRVFYMTSGRNAVFFSHASINSGSPLAHYPTPNMPVLMEGTVISNCFCTGFEVELEAQITPVYVELTDANIEYTVPPGKVFFLKSGLMNDDSGNIKVDGMDIEFFRPNLSRWSRVVTFPSGTVLSKPNNPPTLDTFILTGYLIDN